MDISNRLKTVAKAVTPGRIPADIGTDHGYVPIYLVKHGICPKALALDINPGPLARARENIEREKLEDRIAIRLSDGLKHLRTEEADTIIIAGMGGTLICRILEAAPDFFAAGKELILSPHSEWFKVRHFLSACHYRIGKEWFLKEDGKYYVVIRAWPGEERGDGPPFKKRQEEVCARYGPCLLEEGDPLLYEYLVEDVKKKKKILLGLAARGKKETPRYKEIESLTASALYAMDIIVSRNPEAAALMQQSADFSEPDDKPGYVVNDHLSDPAVAGRL